MTLDPLHNYFLGEKQGAWILLVSGFAFLAFSFYFRQSALNGMIWPIGAIGLLVIAVGASIIWKNTAQVQDLVTVFEQGNIDGLTAEVTRITKVNESFHYLMIAEAGLIVIGLVLAFVFPLASLMNGIGLGLVAIGSFMLLFDSFAHQRASVYADWLQTIVG